MKLSDLPPGKLRDQALAKLGHTPTPKTPRRRAETSPVRCCTCGEVVAVNASGTALDRHGCTGRYECDLEAG